MKTLFKIISLILLFTLTVTAVFAKSEDGYSSLRVLSSREKARKPSSKSSLKRLTQEKLLIKDIMPKEKEEPKKWSISLTSENSAAISNTNESYNGDIYGFQTASFGYAFEPTIKGQIAQDWETYYGTGQNEKGQPNNAKTTMLDTSFRLTKTNVLKSNDLSWLIQGRYYAPTSEASQAARQIGQIRLYFIGESEISKKTSAFVLISPRYFIQRDKQFEDTYGDAGPAGKTVDNNHWRILNSLGFKYAFTDELSVETTGGVYSKKKYNQSMKHYQDFSTSMYLAVGSHLNLNLGIRALDSNQEVQEEGLNFYDAKVSEYFAILTLSI